MIAPSPTSCHREHNDSLAAMAELSKPIGTTEPSESLGDGVLNSPFLTLKEVARYFRLKRVTLYKMVKDRKIPAFKIGGRWRFKKSVIEKMADRDQ